MSMSYFRHPDLELPTREELAWALLNLLDGVEKHDLHNLTGLPEEENSKIWDIRSRTASSYGWNYELPSTKGGS